VGTDGTAGLMLHRELELDVEAGIPPLKALQDATLVAATVLREALWGDCDQAGLVGPGVVSYVDFSAGQACAKSQNAGPSACS
jgi:hypothetical protein